MRSLALSPSWFVLRTPLLSIDQFLEWSRAECHHASPDELRRLLRRADLHEALWLASPTLTEALDPFLGGAPLDPGLKASALAYFTRACSRATPFGLFAGQSLGRVSSHTSLALGSKQHRRRYTQLHAVTLETIVRTLEIRLRRHLSYLRNSSLYLRGTHWHYVESLIDSGQRRHDYVRVEANPVLTTIIESSRTPRTFEALTTVALTAAGNPNLTADEAAAFIETLIASDILISTLVPPGTGPVPLQHVLRELRRVKDAGRDHALLSEAAGILTTIDRRGVGVEATAYDGLATAMLALGVEEPVPRYHVDMAKRGGRLRLGRNVVAAVEEGLHALHLVSPDTRDARLEAFTEAFAERFGDTEVPLLDALDDDVGLGFGDQAAEDLGLSEPVEFPKARKRSDVPAWTARDHYLYERLSLLTGAEPLVLAETDVHALTEPDQLPLPDAFHVEVTLAAASAIAADRGEFQALLHHLTGPSGARMVGRFAHGDRAIRQLVTHHLRAEEGLASSRSGERRIYAEIVHQPDATVANITARPVLRGYEIPYLGTSGALLDRQIPVSELTVAVVNGEVILRWPKHDVRVIPRLTSAHNYFQRRPVLYRFLCALQMQGHRQPLVWTWGGVEALPFLPRVVFRKTVLTRARWRLTSAELTRLRGVQDERARAVAVGDWRQRRGIPRYGRLMSGDQELLIDFDNAASVDCFLEFTRGPEARVLWEQFPPFDEQLVTGDDGRYLHELLLLFVRDAVTTQRMSRPGREEQVGSRLTALSEVSPALRRASLSAPVRPTYAPGSEWTYLKLYSDRADLDDLLLAATSQVVNPLRDSGAIGRWFFVRYADPHLHLRLRLQASDGVDPERVVSAAVQWAGTMVDTRLLSRVQLDTYQPESHRYGGPSGLALVHDVFVADSDAAATIVALVRPAGDRWLRSAATMMSVDLLLDDFRRDFSRRLEDLRAMKAALARQIPIDLEVKRTLGRIYRSERARVLTFFDGNIPEEEPAASVRQTLRGRSAVIGPIVSALLAAEVAGGLTCPVRDILHSLVHMTMNRLLRRSRFEQEWQLYDLLARFYPERQIRKARDQA